MSAHIPNAGTLLRNTATNSSRYLCFAKMARLSLRLRYRPRLKLRRRYHVALTQYFPTQIRQAFETILSKPASTTNPAVGVLTSLPRDDWAQVRNEMVADPTNKQALHDIDSALFIVSLEVCIARVRRQRCIQAICFLGHQGRR